MQVKGIANFVADVFTNVGHAAPTLTHAADNLVHYAPQATHAMDSFVPHIANSYASEVAAVAPQLQNMMRLKSDESLLRLAQQADQDALAPFISEAKKLGYNDVDAQKAAVLALQNRIVRQGLPAGQQGIQLNSHSSSLVQNQLAAHGLGQNYNVQGQFQANLTANNVHDIATQRQLANDAYNVAAEGGGSSITDLSGRYLQAKMVKEEANKFLNKFDDKTMKSLKDLGSNKKGSTGRAFPKQARQIYNNVYHSFKSQIHAAELAKQQAKLEMPLLKKANKLHVQQQLNGGFFNFLPPHLRMLIGN